jgi:acrylyl-CoA reductase (NADPH)
VWDIHAKPTDIQEKSMTSDEFQGLLLREVDGAITATVETLQTSDLPDGDVTVRVEYSDVNYKDGMAITGVGHRRIAQFFPFIPGIDFAGVVEDSRSTRFAPGDRVVLTGWGVGEKWWGGYAQKARVKAEWLVPLPDGMTTRSAMALGTAGFSAMLCVDALDRHGLDRSREVLVTGAAGGVGSVSVMLLKQLGYRVVASSGRAEEEGYLRSLGAESVIARSHLSEPSQPLLPERWAGVIDTVGSHTLATALAATVYDGAVAAIGLVAGRDLPTTVLPFIIRSVTLIGIDSVYCPTNRRLRAWQRLTELLPEGLPNQVVEEIGLSDLPERAAAILKGKTRGRLVVKF